MEYLYYVSGLILLGAMIHVVVVIRDVNKAINGIFNYSKELRNTDGFTKIGMVLPYIYSVIVYIYGYIFTLAVLVLSGISIVILVIGWIIWFYGNIIALFIMKDVKWTVPHYMWGKKNN